MAKKSFERICLAQNFLKSPGLVRRLVAASSIGPRDTVYEIGPGRGIITAELARAARRVVAIEKDPALAGSLRERFAGTNNVAIVEGDFLQYRIPEREYKIFANIPYNLTAEIVRTILFAAPTPDEACLVMQRQAAGKFAGCPRETQFSVLAKPWWSIEIVRELRRSDFEPAPRVDSVLLRFRKRSPPLLRGQDAPRYRTFVRYGFGRWKRSLKLAFKPVFSHAQWKRLSKNLCFPPEAAPSELTFEQWIGLFECFTQRVPAEKRALRVRRT